MRLRWGQRLTPIVYVQQGMRRSEAAAAAAHAIVQDQHGSSEREDVDEDAGSGAETAIDLTTDAEPLTPVSTTGSADAQGPK
ncbi:hypothetical protein HIM_05859 [Hirsutella minnesotensis 3608]|uniref:Uncharacterized protein n=1 Tax=Hirsutella minnesotensis 3608 TaxID=1043627 RepID=A0A0F7ZZS7_9HYPO|nr:hypothetical protein HIM_05859 [Hirsutella minnesotensis 3608]